MKKLYNIVLVLSDIFRAFIYHKKHGHRAKIALRNMEVDKGKLSEQLSKQCDAYAIKILGSKKYSPWLKVYALAANQFRNGWIPDNYYGDIVLSTAKLGALSEHKTLNSMIFRNVELLDVFYVINHRFYDVNYKLVNTKKAIELLSNNKHVFKQDNVSRGRGIHIISKSFMPNWELMGDGVIQRYVNQHQFLNEFTPNSVATFRVTSKVVNGNVKIIGCFLRFGRDIDNYVKADSLIRVSVCTETGKLDKYGYLPDWRRIQEHPDSKVSFENKIVPAISNILAYCRELHRNLLFVECIGWDIALDEKEKIQLLEWNGLHNDIKFHEAMSGPNFTDMNWEEIWKSVPESGSRLNIQNSRFSGR